MTFEENLQRLERIARELDRADLSLDESLKLFEEGLSRLRAATEELRVAEGRVKELVKQADGVFALEDPDDGD